MIKYQDIIKLFGYSELSPEVKEIFSRLYITGKRPEMSVCWRTYHSDKWDLTLEFKAKNNYKGDYGSVIKEYVSDYDESFLEEVSFGGTGKGTNYPHALPHSLTWGDSTESVQKKLSVKKSEVKKASYGSYMIFNLEDYWVLTAFDDDGKLIWLRLHLHEQSFKRKRELTKTIRLQNKNLNISNIDEFKQLKGRSPVKKWKRRMKDGDENFTNKNIEDSETLLGSFIDNLIVAVDNKKASSIYSETKMVVKAFNKLNHKYPGFIETLEREELVEFLHTAIRMTGFQIEPDIDLTEEWREW